MRKYFEYLKSALQSPSARIFLGASFLSNIGDWIYFVGLSAFVYSTSGVEAVAALAVLRQLPFVLLAPLAGGLIDRFPRKTLILIVNFISAACMAVLTALSFAGVSNLSLVYTLVLITSIMGIVDKPAKYAIIPKLVNEEARLALNTLNGAISTLALLVAPIVGGLLVYLQSNAWNFLINAVSFVVMIVMMATLPKEINQVDPSAIEQQTEQKSRFQKLVDDWSWGFVFLYKQKKVRIATIFLAANGFAVGATWVFIPELARITGQGEPGIGYLTAAIGYGSFLGSLLGTAIGKRSLSVAGNVSVLGLGISILLAGFFPELLFAFVACALMGAFANIGDGPLITILQNQSEDAKAGRIWAALDAVIVGTMALGSYLVGWLLVNAKFAVALCAIGGVLIVMVLLFGKVLFQKEQEGIREDDTVVSVSSN